MISFYKNLGETPLQSLERLRLERPELTNEKLSYAGRLDPLAEGEMLVLVGEENKEREKYLGLDKTYRVEVLFGVSTDTGDVLGLITDLKYMSFDNDALKKILQESIMKFDQTYPVYSSKTVQGKSLFQWAREGRLNEIKIPTKEVEIYSAKLLDTYIISSSHLLERALMMVNSVKGDFRQEEIRKNWEQIAGRPDFVVATIEVSCSSGTYMRSLAETLGNKLKMPALALKIVRTKIGK